MVRKREEKLEWRVIQNRSQAGGKWGLFLSMGNRNRWITQTSFKTKSDISKPVSIILWEHSNIKQVCKSKVATGTCKELHLSPSGRKIGMKILFFFFFNLDRGLAHYYCPITKEVAANVIWVSPLCVLFSYVQNEYDNYNIHFLMRKLFS